MAELTARQKEIMDLLIMLYNDQTGEEHTYRLIDDGKDKTA